MGEREKGREKKGKKGESEIYIERVREKESERDRSR